MKLNYLVISSEPEVKVKFFYEGEYDKEKQEYKQYGEFYINFTRESKDANNKTDKLGVRGHAELLQKDPDYAEDLIKVISEELT